LPTGNPTGQVLPLKNLNELVNFAFNEKILLMADEVGRISLAATRSGQRQQLCVSAALPCCGAGLASLPRRPG
jgi:hypothetical protein